MKKHIFSVLFCAMLLPAVLLTLPNRAEAATAQQIGNAVLEEALKQDGTFPATLSEGATYSAPCYACGGAVKQWKPMTAAVGAKCSDGDHYYFPKDVSIEGQAIQLADGKTVCVHTNGHTRTGDSRFAITAAGMSSYAKYFTAAVSGYGISVADNGTLSCERVGAFLVKADGTEVVSSDLLTDWATGDYAYIKLGGAFSLAMSGEKIVIDLAGKDLTVTGTGELSVFDSANDTYDAEACGVVTNNGSVAITDSVVAPNGNTYVATAGSNGVTAHRLNIKFTNVTLRTTEAGVYYKATYTCDATLAKLVNSYGVAVSLNNMPGADFKTEKDDRNAWSVASAPFQSGVVATSGSVFGIMKDERQKHVNDAYGKLKIYANAYIDFGNGPIVSDVLNSGLGVNDAGFDSIAMSLYDVMMRLDADYKNYDLETRLKIDAYYLEWKDKGMDWNFQNIGNSKADTESPYTKALQFVPGTTTAQCPVCQKKVTWTPVYKDATAFDLDPSDTKDHYYLAEDVTYTGSSTFFQSRIKDRMTCFHLNGHNLTTTKAKAFFGSNGRTNIMGSGVVTGYQKYAGEAAALQINNMVATNGLYVYGGTYRKTEDSHKDAVVACIYSNGSTINLYEGVIIDAPDSLAIRVYIPKMKNAELGLYGCTVDGDIQLDGAAEGGYTSKTVLQNCTVKGTISIDAGTQVLLKDTPKIDAVEFVDGILMDTTDLSIQASIGIGSTGTFIAPRADVADYIDCFFPVHAYHAIVVRDQMLYCGSNYLANIESQFETGTTDAVCPVCQEKVTWTPVYKDATAFDLDPSETRNHYYLAEDVTYTGSSTFFQSRIKDRMTCFHLNGHNLTATKAKAFFGSNSRMNILGNGVVTGHQSSAGEGAALQINNTISGNGLYVYSGTYRKTVNSNAQAAVACIYTNGSILNLYEEVTIDAPNSVAINVAIPTRHNAELGLYGCTVNGDVVLQGADPTQYAFTASAEFDNCTVNGNVTVAANHLVTVSGWTRIRKLTLAAGELVTFNRLEEGADITVSAQGVFSGVMSQAHSWLQYLTCSDEGDWIIVRDKQFYQGARQSLLAATQEDQAALNAVYNGTTVKHGDLHCHTNVAGSDGKNNLAEWKAEMVRLQIDFATIVNHCMSVHMYHDDFDPKYFLGGSEPGTTLSDSKAVRKTFDYSMMFADSKKFESVLRKWNDKYNMTQKEDEEGYHFNSTYGAQSFTVEQFKTLAQDVYDAGGLLILVHPKNIGYLTSNDPLDYYFGENFALEISTGLTLSNGDGGNMCAPSNEKAYRLWVDLLEMGKKVWATAGSDSHNLPNVSAMTSVYTTENHSSLYMEAVRAGNIAPGWMGIRMNIGGTVMGGEADFSGKRLQFSVGDIYTGDQTEEDPVYKADHIYRVELYDHSGLLMEAVVDPTQINYFAIDCDAKAKFYRVVVWDDTEATRIGVSNPIWNTAEK